MTKKLNQVLAVVLTIAALMTGQVAMAANTWTVTNPTGSTFRITRPNSHVGTTETVKYRTVSLSAYAGQHYTAVSDEVTFDVNDTYKEVTVSETTPGTNAYKYQDGTKRKYRFDVTDQGGFHLAHCDREITTGTRFTNSYVNKSVTDLVYFQSGNVMSGSGNKYLDVAHSGTNGTEKMIDDGYDYNNNTLCTVSTDDLYNNNSDLRSWLNSLHYKMYATVYFQQREVDDGYQYIQILADNATTYDGKDPDGDVNTPSISLYKAAFILTKTENVYTGWKYQAFPHRYGYSTSSTEFDYSDSYLYGQKFQSSDYRATNSGSLVLAPTVNDINVRFDANGSGDDTWYLKNLKVRLALVDGSAPSVLAYSVAPGRHSKGNTLYVSVAFNEIVTTTDAKLTSSWGMLSYVDGSGSNVLTFQCTIPADASGSLIITNHTGTIQDLAGNSIGINAISENNLCSMDASYAYPITYNLNEGTLPDGYPTTYTYNAAVTLDNPTRFGYYFNGWTGSNGNTPQTTVTIAQHSHGNKSYTANWTQVWTGNGTPGDPYTITTTQGLDLLAQYVNSGNDCSTLYFQLGGNIEYTHNTNWDNSSSKENNYTAIGTEDHPFKGTFDGQGYTVRGIRIYKEGKLISHSYLGLFGKVYSGTVKRVNLVDTRITGNDLVSGIVGDLNDGTVKECSVGADVCIHTVIDRALYHGGIVGYSKSGTMRQCISRATLTVANSVPDCYGYGGIAGGNTGSIFDCIADGVVIPDVNTRGAIVGYNEDSLTRNYYHNCKVASNSVTPSGVGMSNVFNSDVTSDVTGAEPLYAVTLPANASLVREPSATLPGSGNKTYDNGADINGQPYAKASAALSLSYNSASIPIGYVFSSISANETSSGAAVALTDNGDYTYDFTMPAADVTVTITTAPAVTYIDENGTEQTCTNFTILSDGTIPIDGYDWGTIGTDGQDTWYVATGNYTFSNHYELKTNGNVHLILCDGATFTVSCSSYGITGPSLTIYGQSEGTGRLVASTTHENHGYGAIYVPGNLTINGGNVSTSSVSGPGIVCANLTINGGNVNVNAAGNGISCSDILLGWTRTTDRIYASSYSCHGTIRIKDGQVFSNGSELLGGTITDLSKLDDKTLTPVTNAVAYVDTDGATKYCADYTVLSDENIPVSSNEGTIGISDQDTWYVASGNYTFNHNKLNALGRVHLILCDEAALTVNGTTEGINAESLSIYSQKLGNGTLTASATGKALSASGNLTINGGIISATGTTSGIYVSGNLTLGWTSTTDRIYANSYSCTGTISINGDQVFNNGEEDLSGTITDLSKLHGKMLTPVRTGGIPYIAADGSKQYCYDYTVLDGNHNSYGTAGETNWYVVPAGYIGIPGLLFKDANTHIIISTGAECDMGGSNNSNTTANGNICFYGQDTGTGYIHFGYHQLYVYGDVSIYGGSILTYSGNYDAGKILTNGKLTLGWTNGDDYIKSAFQYSETYKYNYVDGKYFTDGSTLNPQIYNNSQTYYLSPCIALANNADNSSILTQYNGKTICVRLNDRVLYRDGDWNTICLPFNIADISSSILSYSNLADVRELESASLADGVLTLNFTAVNAIQAGKPYLVRWEKPQNYQPYDSSHPNANCDDWVNPIFVADLPHQDNPIGFTIDYSAEAQARQTQSFDGGRVQFIGNYAPVTLPAGSSNYYLGTENKLYYPSANRTMNAFRAYFHLNSSPNYVKSIKLNFGKTTSLREMRNEKGEMRNGAWYTLDGRKLQEKPTQKGIYIYNGRKIVIK